MTAEPLVVTLSRRQLDAYNSADLDAFCACYHPDVTVLAEDGLVRTQGLSDFRARYAKMFETHHDVHAHVTERIVLGEHVFELEHWSRIERATGTATRGTVMVRYTEADGLLRWAQFWAPLRPAP